MRKYTVKEFSRSFAASLLSAMIGLGAGWVAGGVLGSAATNYFGADNPTSPVLPPMTTEPPAPLPSPDTSHPQKSEAHSAGKVEKEQQNQAEEPQESQEERVKKEVLKETLKQIDKAKSEIEKRTGEGESSAAPKTRRKKPKSPDGPELPDDEA